VLHESYSDAALVLLGHGSTLDDGAGEAVFHQAAELRRRHQFAEVREAFWKQEPAIRDVLAGLSSRRVFIVPMFVSEGYFSASVIPRALGFALEPDNDSTRVQVRKSQILIYCKVVGSHDSLAEVLVARVREVVEGFPFPRPPQLAAITLFIAGHGTEQDENSRKAIERQAEVIRNMRLYADVHAVFLEEEPRISDSYELAKTRNIVVVPFFISGGMHVKSDIPILLGAPRRTVEQRLQRGQAPWRNPTERNGKLVWYSSSVGEQPQVAEVILARVKEAAAWRP